MRSLIMILLVFGLFSCKDKEIAEPEIDKTFTVEINGNHWSGITSLYIVENTNKLIIYGSTIPPEEEKIGMQIEFQGIGQYTFFNNSGSFVSTVGGDVLIQDYRRVQNSTGKVEITKYDHEKKLVEGNFEMVLNKEYSYNAIGADTLKLVNGHFKGKIIPIPR